MIFGLGFDFSFCLSPAAPVGVSGLSIRGGESHVGSESGPFPLTVPLRISGTFFGSGVPRRSSAELLIELVLFAASPRLVGFLATAGLRGAALLFFSSGRLSRSSNEPVVELELIFAWTAGFLPTPGLGEAGCTALLFGLLSSSSNEAVLARSAGFLATIGLGAGVTLAASPFASGSFATIGSGVATTSEELLPRVCFLTGLLLRAGLLMLTLLLLFDSVFFKRFSVELVMELEEFLVGLLAGLVLTVGDCAFAVTVVLFFGSGSFKSLSVELVIEPGENFCWFLGQWSVGGSQTCTGCDLLFLLICRTRGRHFCEFFSKLVWAPGKQLCCSEISVPSAAALLRQNLEDHLTLTT